MNRYFVPALETLIDRWKVPPDVAGATFMAAGASCPEMFANFVGVFRGSPVGTGTVIGR
jgi:Ca2+/Na+ antiporter